MKTLKMKNKAVTGIIMAAMMILAAMTLLSFAAYAAEPTQVGLTVRQVFNADGLSAPSGDVFTYRLTPKAVSSPMPEGSGSDGYTFTVAGTDEAPISPITFSETGIYAYELRCMTAAETGYTVDPQVYTVEIHIINSLTPISVVYISDGVKADEIAYEHAYDGGSEPSKPAEPTKPITPKPIEPSKPIKPGKPGGDPSTGDDSRVLLYAVLAGTSGIAALASVIYLLAGKRRKKEHGGDET